jgi:hypothetical protein
MVIVDCQAFAFQGQIGNGIYIPPYLGDDKDIHLVLLQQFLTSLGDVADVRPLVKKFSGVGELLSLYYTERQQESQPFLIDPDLDLDLDSNIGLDVANEYGRAL